MSVSDTIKGFYSDFILRDLLSFVTPGAIVIGTLALMFLKIDVSTIWAQIYIVRILSQISIISWILLFGLFYMIGLGIQYVSYKISLYTMRKNRFDLLFPPISYLNNFRTPDGHSKECKRDTSASEGKTEISFGFDETYRNAKYYHFMRLPFLSHSNEIEKKTHERFIVIMQASGNVSIALFIASIIGFFNIISLFPRGSTSQIFWVYFSIFCLILSIILYFNFQDHRQKTLDWEYEVINYFH